MSIFPLPQFEADLAEYEADRKTYEKLTPPKTIVVRFGVMRMIGEFPYKGDAKPGCGSKLVVRTPRGTEIGEMLTSTCPNAGCSKSVTRKEMLEYIENSGGKDYPFFDQGRVLRVATPEDMQQQQELEGRRRQLTMRAREAAERHGLAMRVVEAEEILGGERVTYYYMSEERVDFRELARELSAEHRSRVDFRQVGARDEARLVADYERCGQHCCCKQFLKVLSPVSMKSAKVQKATLDPLKISGRCGRLMCCLRYEDQTYADLQARLPKRRTRVGTPEGPGVVIDHQILTQLVLVQLEHLPRQIAVPLEELIPVEEAERRVALAPPASERPVRSRERRGAEGGPAGDRRERPRGKDRGGKVGERAGVEPGLGGGPATAEGAGASAGDGTGEAPAKRRRRRGRRGRGEGEEKRPAGEAGASGGPEAQAARDSAGEAGERPRERRREGRGPVGGDRARSGAGAAEAGGGSGGPEASGPESGGGAGEGEGVPGEAGADRPRKKRRRRRGPRPDAGGGAGSEGSGGPGEGGGGGGAE